MHVNALRAPARQIYVPTNPQSKEQEGERRRTARLPRSHALVTAQNVFRLVAWEPGDGSVRTEPTEADLVVSARRVERPRLDAAFTTRALFASVLWTGEAPEPPTADQAQKSVRNVIAAFGWD